MSWRLFRSILDRSGPRLAKLVSGTHPILGCRSASGALLASSQALLRSSSARFASQERSRCVLGSILGPSGPQNLCSRRGESIDFRKSAFPLSIFILGPKSPLKVTSWTPKWRSRRAQSASRALPDALQDAFSSSQGVSWGAPGWPRPPGGSRDAPGTALGPFSIHFGPL